MLYLLYFNTDHHWTGLGAYYAYTAFAQQAGFEPLGLEELTKKTIEDELVSSQIEQDIRNLVDLLPKEQREVVMMRYYSGLSFKEIAEQTDVSINTALGRMRYALINLRRMIKEKNLVLC